MQERQPCGQVPPSPPQAQPLTLHFLPRSIQKARRVWDSAKGSIRFSAAHHLLSSAVVCPDLHHRFPDSAMFVTSSSNEYGCLSIRCATLGLRISIVSGPPVALDSPSGNSTPGMSLFRLLVSFPRL